mmetsp:Transcript_71534/g.232475  ORF Transcript_71534/g.232475 Transcript_71534/m.232475 type:complete len:237 (+) Transcript_71534:728-1438(+)
MQKLAVVPNGVPYRHEDVQVQCSSKLSTFFALQAAIHDAHRNPKQIVNRFVTIHRVLVTQEDPDSLAGLRSQELLFVTPWQDQDKAIQRVSEPHSISARLWHAGKRTQEPLLIHVFLVTTSHVDLPTINICLCSVHADASPIFHEACVAEIIPLLVPICRIALTHDERRQLCRSLRGAQATAALVFDLACAVGEGPLLIGTARDASPHLHSDARLAYVRRIQALALPVFHDFCKRS